MKATGIGEDTHLITLNQELAMAKQNKAKLLVQFTENYPTVLEAENQIQSLSKEIENRKKETLKGIKVSRGIYDKPSQDIVTDMARVQAESISLKAQLNAMKQGISNLLAKENLLQKKYLD
ncbi:MAG: hypothetical protein MZU84_03735 [Sphingobacterium sp.]|nr:hypothetical protein [Sphingobacterium sp.]